MLIEEQIIAYLNAEDDLSPAYAEVPQNPPEQFLIVERTSGSELDFVRSATVAIQCISLSSLYNAATMAEWVKILMDGFAEATQDVFSCRLNSMYNFTDTDTKQYRYQCVFDLHYQDNWE